MIGRSPNARGKAELRTAWGRLRPLFWAVVLFSAFVNLLMLTGPLFMMQVYDRVLASGSEATLTALFALVAFLFGAMAVLDVVRNQIMSRAGSRFQATMDRRVFDAALRRQAVKPDDPAAAAAERDVDTLRQFAASPVFFALIDLPWAPVFLGGIFFFHPLMGGLAIAGGGVLLAMAILNQMLTGRIRAEAAGAGLTTDRLGAQFRAEAGPLAALGMRGAAQARWEAARGRMLERAVTAGDLGSVFGSASRTFRQFLQSAMLALGAWLALEQQISAGVMIACSVLLGRALAPVETLVGQWSFLQSARFARERLATLLTVAPPLAERMPLARPEARLQVEGLAVAPPGERRLTLQKVSFTLEPGQVVGVIGPSAAGKSSLARAVSGIWPVVAGSVRLGGVSIGQYGEDMLGRLIGYLPQRVTLFDGTVAENIARLTPGFRSEDVLRAAARAGAHEMILSLPDGYDTRLTVEGGGLSGGQVQRIGLARALYGDPVLLVLDEPNANLDNDGSAAVNAAIHATRAAGGIVMVMAHRPAALQECGLILMLDGGRQLAFGPRDAVLRDRLRNPAQVLRTARAGGGA
ncbi:type I secretion system permease/ATPase [Paenirhodobacter populi]|uniref:type I secretion system permease/ATPase n=1 Tax=Paenirhodobacter populi TaxID=2306993 RepID=UPI001F4F236F|nr:type I secretion system permease/ATPase [Sinirhodobacter populi]